MKNNRKILVGQVRENRLVEGELYVILSVGVAESKIKLIKTDRKYVFISEWNNSDIQEDIVVM